MNIAILGAGAWGTALAMMLAGRHEVVLWGRNEIAMRESEARRENLAYLPGFRLPAALVLTADFDRAVSHAASSADSLLIVATSVAGLRPLVERLRAAKHALPNLVWLCKGFEENTRLLPHQVVRSILGNGIAAGIAHLDPIAISELDFDRHGARSHDYLASFLRRRIVQNGRRIADRAEVGRMNSACPDRQQHRARKRQQTPCFHRSPLRMRRVERRILEQPASPQAHRHCLADDPFGITRPAPPCCSYCSAAACRRCW